MRGMAQFTFRRLTLLLSGGWIGGKDGVQQCWWLGLGSRGGLVRVRGVDQAELGDFVDMGG